VRRDIFATVLTLPRIPNNTCSSNCGNISQVRSGLYPCQNIFAFESQCVINIDSVRHRAFVVHRYSAHRRAPISSTIEREQLLLGQSWRKWSGTQQKRQVCSHGGSITSVENLPGTGGSNRTLASFSRFQHCGIPL